ncbi:MAG: DNA polymerase III subunit delta' [Pseudomonadota bacterium]
MNIIELHEESWLQLDARRSSLPSALLLAGQRGNGKFELAQHFVASLLCENLSATHQACTRCLACGWFAQGNHPDFRLLQAENTAAESPLKTSESPSQPAPEETPASEGGASKKLSRQITIEQIRALDEFLHIGTHREGARIVLIHGAEAMNRATANALLKSLEEPLPGTLFLLVSDEADRLLPTVRSRCQLMTIPPVNVSRALRYLQDEQVEDAARYLALAGGAPLLAAQLSRQGARQLLDALLVEMSRGRQLVPVQSAAALERILKADKNSAALKRLIEWAQKWLFDLALTCLARPPRYFLAETASLKSLAALTNTLKIMAFNRKAIQYKADCEQTLNTRLFLENFFIHYAALFQKR